MYQMSQTYSIDQLVAPYFSQRDHHEISRYRLQDIPADFSSTSFINASEPFFSNYSSASSTGNFYNSKTNAPYHSFKAQPEYHFTPDHFLKPGTGGKFIGATEEVIQYVKEAFSAIFDKQLPENINLFILNAAEFRKLAPNPSTIGFSINRGQYGLISEIFVLNDSLGRVLLTIGHELGHVLTATLGNHHDEEAKAYAFSFLWMEKIKEHNIAGLGKAIITELPALNGLHDVAFGFVKKLLLLGKGIKEIYRGLVKGFISYRKSYF